MKKIYFLVLALCFFNGLSAQVINFPDANFKAKLLSAVYSYEVALDLDGKRSKIDINGNGEIEISEAEQISELYLTEYTISKRVNSLVGILYFKNLKKITLEFGLLTNVDLVGLENLQSLVCGGNHQLTFINLHGLNNLKTLDISECNITNLNLSTLTNLQTLDCSVNKLSRIDINGLFNLESLKCNYNQFTSLSIIDLKKLTYLECSNNPLVGLNLSGLDNLNFLQCDYTNMLNLDLSNLPKLESVMSSWGNLEKIKISNLPNLKRLLCYYNKLTEFKVSGTSQLEVLGCANNVLSNLNLSGFNELKFLNCATNMLSSLDLSNLSKLETLYCEINQIASLNIQSSLNINDVSCYKNQIKVLDLTHLSKIISLNCANNRIEELNLNDAKNIVKIRCNNNNLFYLFIKNGKKDASGIDASFDIYNNPNLQYICADDIDMEYIQHYMEIYDMAKVNLNTYCSFKPGGAFYTIQGINKFDGDGNGCDTLDLSLPNLKFSLSDGTNTGSLISNANGNYSISLQAGTHTVTPVLENPAYFNISPSAVNITFPTQISPLEQDFCIIANGVHPDLEITVLSFQPARPGFDVSYRIIYKNKGNTSRSGSVNLIFNDSVLDFITANPVVSGQTINNLSWNFTNLKPFESKEITFTVKVNTPTATPAVNNGDVLVFTANIASTAADETPKDNKFTLNQTVVGSFDPNDKTCLEGSIITPALIGEYVHYMIRFENKGTYPAQNIVVKDMIDLSKFDVSTLIPTSASHSYTTKISDGNKVEFIFENINLPFDDANNDGYIAFKIKTKPTLVVGDSFVNEANIYFDYNFPVLTNKATSTFKIIEALNNQDFEFSNYFIVYPNPVNEALNISTTKAIEIQSIAVYDILGQLVIALPNIKDVSKIDVSNLRTGNYFIKVNSDKGSSNMKFIKN
jgi:hypothetical protein